MRLVPPIFALVALALAPIPVRAQHEHMLPEGDFYERTRAEFRAKRMKDFTAFSARWRAALDARDLDALADLYHPDAVVVADSVLRGGDAIRAFLDQRLATMTDLQMGVEQFEAGGSFLWVIGRYELRTGPTLRPGDRAGTYALLLEDRRGRWRIRSQIFTAEPS